MNIYIEYAKKNFKGKALNMVLESIKSFFTDSNYAIKNKYKVGDQVFLKKGTFMHGIPGLLENFDWIIKYGFIAKDFSNGPTKTNKIKNSIGMWNIKEDGFLKDYIYNYSGFTINYYIGRGPEAINKSELVPYHQFDKVTEEFNNREDVWTYSGEKTKEINFLPSLVSNKVQIAFILNMESEYAKKIVRNDLWTINLSVEELSDFIDYRYLEKFLKEKANRTALTTDRESAIMFGVSKNLIEGVLVGRKLEEDSNSLSYIKQKLPNCYIVNLDGIVIK